MSIFGKLVAATIRTATLPLSIVADVATLGGAAIGREETYTGNKVRRIIDDVEEAADEASE